MTGVPYNPLDKTNLGKSIQNRLLEMNPSPIGEPGRIQGAGVYAIYYSGNLEFYAPIKCNLADWSNARPIYVGKAIPKGGRKGGLSNDASRGTALADRLRQHSASIKSTALNVADFWIRYLVVDDIWIPLGENVLIETFKPVWNNAIDGFGNKDPGQGRMGQDKSPWDVLHPGRGFAVGLRNPSADRDFFIRRVIDFLAGHKLEPLPKMLRRQMKEHEERIQDLADDL